MEKPLHELAAYSVAANAAMVKTDTLIERLVVSANDGDELAKRWLDRLARYGASEAFSLEIESHARTVRYETHAKFDRQAGKFHWERDLFPNQKVTREGAYAMILVLLINSGKVDYIRRCDAQDCRRLFFGPQNKRWCSDRCGSRVRVTKKRKRERGEL